MREMKFRAWDKACKGNVPIEVVARNIFRAG